MERYKATKSNGETETIDLVTVKPGTAAFFAVMCDRYKNDPSVTVWDTVTGVFYGFSRGTLIWIETCKQVHF